MYEYMGVGRGRQARPRPPGLKRKSEIEDKEETWQILIIKN
jgi:hypothetical protein